MRLTFDPHRKLIVVPTRLWGPTADLEVQLALDTGATGSMVREDVALTLGYDPATALEWVRVATASGLESIPRITVDRIQALGKELSDFPVLCHMLPPCTTVDGLLGRLLAWRTAPRRLPAWTCDP